MAKYTKPFVYAVLTTLFVCGLYAAGIFSGFNLFATDLLYSEKKVAHPVVVVAIDDVSIQSVGQWPWRREVYADLLEELREASPSVVAFDILFSETSRYGEDDDQAFAQAILDFPAHVILAEEIVFDNRGVVVSQNRPLEIFNAKTGHINLTLDRDNVLRRMPTKITVKDTKKEPFVYEVAGKGSEEESRRIVYRGGPGAVTVVPVKDILSGTAVSQIPAHAYVFVGSTAASLHDEHATPLSKGVLTSGVEIQAQMLDNILTGDRLRDISSIALFAIITLLVFLSWVIGLYVPKISITSSLLVGLFITQIIAVIISFEVGVVIPIVYTSLAVLLSGILSLIVRYVYSDSEKRVIKNAFKKYVSEDVLGEIMENPDAVSLGGKEFNATILFSDVRGFTSLSEKLTPTELVTFLNMYLSRMTNIVLDNKGVIDKYIGDAIMAFWGAPLQTEDHAYKSIVAAALMVDGLVEFNREAEEKGYSPIALGIGINTGDIVAGNMGSEKRFDYTVMGDSVNLASRLEGQSKQYGVEIIASEYTLASLSDMDKHKLESSGVRWREIDTIAVKGKKKPVSIFEVLSPNQAREKEDMLRSFDDVYAYYKNADWKKCIDACEQYLKIWNDAPTSVILERAQYYIKHPDEWVGYHISKKK